MTFTSKHLHAFCVLGGVIFGVLLYSLFALHFEGVNVADMGLGRNTGGKDAVFEGQLLNCSTDECMGDIVKSSTYFHEQGNRLVLWLGNSQLHAINFMKPSDQLAVYFVNEQAKRSQMDLRYLQVSIPHANFHEHLANYLKARQMGLKPQKLLIAAVYYDLHSRKLMAQNLPAITPEDLRVGKTGVAQLSELVEERTLEQARARQLTQDQEEETPQMRIEKRIMAFLEKNWRAYSLRSVLIAQPEFMANELFSKFVRSTFKRRSPDIPAERRQWNLEALLSLIRIAKADGVEVILYRPPIRPHYETYLNVADYNEFFGFLTNLSRKEGLKFFDLEGLVDEQYWGFANGGLPDYFHFQEEGHLRLARAVDANVNKSSQPSRSHRDEAGQSHAL